MDKQYSVRFFTSLLEAVQKLCREYLDFDQCVDVSGYLALEIDNYKKERFVISELLQSTGDVISESYCTKAFKTQRKHSSNRTDDVLKERNSNLNRLADEQRASNLSLFSSKHTISPRNSFSNSRHGHVSSHTVVRADQSYHSDQSAMPGSYYQSSITSSSEWTPVIDSIQSTTTADTGGISSHSVKRSLPSSEECPSAKTLKTENISLPLSISSPYSNQDKSMLSTDHSGASCTESAPDPATDSSLTESVRLPIPVEVKEELDDCVLIDSADEAEDRDLQNVLSADDSSNSMFDNSSLPMSFSTGEGYPGMSDQPGSSQQKFVSMQPLLMKRPNMKHIYTAESLNAAIKAVMEKQMSAKAASEFYHIPRATIYDKLPRPTKQQAKTAILTQTEEEELADFIIQKYESGQPLSKIEVLKEVKRMCDYKPIDGLQSSVTGQSMKQRIRERTPDYFWLTNFCKRHPRVSGFFLSHSILTSFN